MAFRSYRWEFVSGSSENSATLYGVKTKVASGAVNDDDIDHVLLFECVVSDRQRSGLGSQCANSVILLLRAL